MLFTKKCVDSEFGGSAEWGGLYVEADLCESVTDFIPRDIGQSCRLLSLPCGFLTFLDYVIQREQRGRGKEHMGR